LIPRRVGEIGLQGANRIHRRFLNQPVDGWMLSDEIEEERDSDELPEGSSYRVRERKRSSAARMLLVDSTYPPSGCITLQAALTKFLFYH
jgi:hypothetical protein